MLPFCMRFRHVMESDDQMQFDDLSVSGPNRPTHRQIIKLPSICAEIGFLEKMVLYDFDARLLIHFIVLHPALLISVR